MSSHPRIWNGNGHASTSTAHLQTASGVVRQRYERTASSTNVPPHRDAGYRKAPSRAGGADKGGSRVRGRQQSKRAWVREGFRMFGEHCARNQIRTLLIDCLVMTNLFYPALSIYLQKRFPPLHPPYLSVHDTHKTPLHHQAQQTPRPRKEHPLSLLSTPVLDSFFPYTPPLLPPLTWGGWWDTGQSDGDEGWHASSVRGTSDVVDAKEEVRLVRVGWADVGDVLDGDADGTEGAWTERDLLLLRLLSDAAEAWATEHATTGEDCVRNLGSEETHSVSGLEPCYILSPRPGPNPVIPLEFFSMGIPRNSTYEDGHTPIVWLQDDTSVYHSIAIMFHVFPSSRDTFNERWVSTLQRISQPLKGEVFVEATGVRGAHIDRSGDWMLSYRSRVSTQSDSSDVSSHPPMIPSNPPLLVLLLYVVLFVALASRISNASKVHSRFGLAFTGIVQLCCSAVMSISVLAILGWNGWGSSQAQPTLPSYVLPFVIVVVGVENMSTLTKAVFSVPFTYSVPVRIGLALSKVGTTIAITSLTDLLVLGAVWLCISLGPVREFCLFAAVVIITDWFMLHTFFLTVLSIDAQRLELADVLSSNGGIPTPPVQDDGEPDDGGREKLFSWKRLVRARTAKSGSLLVLLVTIVIIYYLTERHHSSSEHPASLYGYIPSRPSTPIQTAVARPYSSQTHLTELASLPPAERLWRSLNPSNWPTIRVLAPSASIVILPRPGHHMQPTDIRKLSLPTSRLVLPRLTPLFYLFKVVILPQAVTATALYALLLYLLKDSELLDAQRNKLGRTKGPPESESESSRGLNSTTTRDLKVHMLPCSHAADIDLIAGSARGHILLSVAVDSTVCLWRFSETDSGCGTREPLHAATEATDGPIVAVTVDTSGTYVAVCLASGSIRLWDVHGDGKAIALPSRQIDGSAARIGTIAFAAGSEPEEDPFTEPSTLQAARPAPSLLVGFEDGSVTLTTNETSSRQIIRPTGVGLRVFFMSRPERIVVGTPLNPTIYRRSTNKPLTSALVSINEGERLEHTEWAGISLSSLTTLDDHLTAVSQHSHITREGSVDYLALGYSSGTIEIYDACNAPLVTIPQAQSSERINRIEIVSSANMICVGCGTISKEGFLVVSSSATKVHLDRVLPKAATFCRCTPVRRRSSAEEIVTVPAGKSPVRGLIVPPSPARAISPGSSPRKSPSLLPPISNGEFPLSSHGGARRLSNLHRDDDVRVQQPSSLELVNGMPSTTSSGSNDADWEVHPLGAIFSPSSSGCWTGLEDRLVGMRRAGGGVDDSGWQVWSVDLARAWNGTTLIVDSAPFAAIAMRTARDLVTSSAGLSIRERRNQRLLSMDGRASFPGLHESLSVTTYPGLAYVEVRPFDRVGPRRAVGGFGNRLGVISIEREKTNKSKSRVSGTGAERSDGGAAVVSINKKAYVGSGVTPPPPRADSARKNI